MGGAQGGEDLSRVRVRDRQRSMGEGGKVLKPPERLEKQPWDFPGGPVAKAPHSQCRGTQVQSLVRELRSHMPCSQKYIKKKKITPNSLSTLPCIFQIF